MPMPGRVFAAIVFLLMWMSQGGSAEENLSRRDVARMAKPATVLVDAKPHGMATAFCIHASGLFITNEHVVQGVKEDGTVTLVLDAGLKAQRTVKAKVLRRDKDLDLALLQTETGDQPFTVLALGSEANVTELAELVVLGFPFGNAMERSGDLYPTVSINAVNVSSLRMDSARELNRIQVDSNLNPGNSGGPVLDRSGKVVGVVVSGIMGAGINLVIPVRHVQKFIERPVITLTPPVVTLKNRHMPTTFRATATSFVPDQEPLSLELCLLSQGASERRIPMKLSEGKYSADAVAFPGTEDRWDVRLEVKFQDGSVAGVARDGPVQIDHETVALSEIREMKMGENGGAELRSGKRLHGPPDIQSLPMRLGGQVVEVKLAHATELRARRMLRIVVCDARWSPAFPGMKLGGWNKTYMSKERSGTPWTIFMTAISSNPWRRPRRRLI